MNRRLFISKSAVSAIGLSLARKGCGEKTTLVNPLRNELSLSLDDLEDKLAGIKPRHPSLHFNAEKLKELVIWNDHKKC